MDLQKMVHSDKDPIKLAAVVVFYYPSQADVDNLLRIATQIDFVIVVCNSNVDLTRFDLVDKKDIQFLMNHKNTGLGAALNQGLLYAFGAGYDLVCTFDQDTVIFNEFKSNLLHAYHALSKNHNIGVLAPEYTDGTSSKMAYHVDGEYFLISAATQSGCLFTKECIDACGYFREDFFIEGIDTEFCLRARNFGFDIGCCGTSLMEHGAGEKNVKKLFGRDVIVTNHSAERIFLQYRNYTFIFKNYFWSDPKWAMKSLFNMVKKYIIICIYETNKFNKGRAVFKGVYSGIITKETFDASEIIL